MTTIRQPTQGTGALRPARSVVAVALTWNGRIGLFKRSDAVGHDAGLWHCITGYLEPGNDPLAQALEELHEEAGLRACDLTHLTTGPAITIPDQHGHLWTVATFHASTSVRRLKLNWEHDQHRWVRPGSLARFDGQVTWLNRVLRDLHLTPGSGTQTWRHHSTTPRALPRRCPGADQLAPNGRPALTAGAT